MIARNHGKFLLVSSDSFDIGDSGGWSSLKTPEKNTTENQRLNIKIYSNIIPGDSSSPPLACSELSLRSDKDETLRRD